MSEPLGIPQIPPFVSRLVEVRSDCKGPREGEMGGVPRDRTKGNRSLGGGDGERLVRGGREGCEESVTRENTTHMQTNRTWGQFTSSSDSKSSQEICKIGNTMSRAQTQDNVQGSAKKAGAASKR